MTNQKNKKIEIQNVVLTDEADKAGESNIEIGVINPDQQDKFFPKDANQVVDEIVEFINKYSAIAKTHGNSSDYASYIAFKSALLKVLLSYKNE